jgi:hypothetical protein
MLVSDGRQLLSYRRLISEMGLIYLLSISFMILSVLAVNLIPNEPIIKMLRYSLPLENNRILFGSTFTDEWTECIAASVGVPPNNSGLGLIERSLVSPTLGNCRVAREYLKEGTGSPFYYWRYWHGTQIIMRPMLAMTHVYNARALTFFLFVSSFIFAFIALYRKGLHLAALAMFAGLFCVHLQSALFILPHAMDWVIGFLACGWIVAKLKGNVPISLQRFCCAFFFVGLMSAFFGLLNNPLVSLTIPLFGVFSAVAFQKEKGAVESYVLVLAAVGFWLTGYIASWSTKWLIAELYYGGVFSELIEVIRHRLGGAYRTAEITSTHSIYRVLQENLVGCILTIACLVASFVPLVRFVKTFEWRRSDWASFVLIFALPFIWFATLRNHTIEHAWYVSAGLYISFAMVFSLLLTSWDSKSNFVTRLVLNLNDTAPTR